MIDFWLGTFEVWPAGSSASGRNEPPQLMAVEVLEDGDDCAVLFSTVDSVRAPQTLRCVLGFTNVVDACNVWRDRGFPLVDAAITRPRNLQGRGDDAFRVVASCFHQAAQMDYESTLVEISVSAADAASRASAVSAPGLTATYQQEFRAPDTAQPELTINRQAVTWSPRRSNVYEYSGSSPRLEIDFGKSPLRFPSLQPLSSGSISLVSAWRGQLELPTRPTVGNVLPPAQVSKILGEPVFRFENVEVLGFRIDLAGFGRDFRADLAAILEPLNFHLRTPDRSGRRPVLDFRYENAAPTVLIELLRYGRMRAKSPLPPLHPDDSQSQHELVVRLLVGRLDDDSARGYAPAVFVPAIFVDNTWSKIIGRDLLGYDKLLAQFSVSEGGKSVPLLPDGRLPGRLDEPPRPLIDVSHVGLSGSAGGGPLLDVDLSSSGQTIFDALTALNLNSPLGLSLLAAVRWRMMDFESLEFRGPFASRAVWESLRAFRCVQVAPLVARELGETWVSGRFVLDPDLQAGLPSGRADLTLHAIPVSSGTGAITSPSVWNRLCAMLGDGRTARLRLPRGSWYRMRCSMNLTIDDQLSWTG